METKNVLARFHAALLEEILARRPEYLREPFTVAEIYQNLVPYGTHRDRIGVEMNGDYEDALLRLLAGEGGYVFLESAPALRALREEMASSNPNTGLYREYAAVDVRLNPAFLAAGRGPSSSAAASDRPEPVSMEDLAPEQPRAPSAPPVHRAPSASAPKAVESPVAPAVPDTCRWCRAELPPRANLNFCPFCGTDVHVVPCPGCGEELDPEWRFCISCGTEVGG
ncbi:MAG TPA: zinc ribbon domain-containing protein [Longimicrobiales bacterium]|nr:zinc ribbon domain-containing protein [Longimicrobiales bacterium]